MGFDPDTPEPPVKHVPSKSSGVGIGVGVVLLLVVLCGVPLLIGAGLLSMILVRTETSRPDTVVVEHAVTDEYAVPTEEISYFEEAAEPTLRSDFAARLQAAQMIQDRTQREEAHYQLTVNLASSADEAVAAIQGIADADRRDEAAAAAAVRLSDRYGAASALRILNMMRGMDRLDAAAFEVAKRYSERERSEDALRVLPMIRDNSMRDAAYRAVASGEWPEENATDTVEEAAVTEAAAGEVAE